MVCKNQGAEQTSQSDFNYRKVGGRIFSVYCCRERRGVSELSAGKKETGKTKIESKSGSLSCIVPGLRGKKYPKKKEAKEGNVAR